MYVHVGSFPASAPMYMTLTKATTAALRVLVASWRPRRGGKSTYKIPTLMARATPALSRMFRLVRTMMRQGSRARTRSMMPE